MLALVDCNNFFVSCERVFQPELRGKPVVVLSNNDGCAVSRSQEAKDLGIQMGKPYFKFSRRLSSEDIRVFSSNFELYADISHRVMTVIKSLAPSMEVYSIDEAFLDVGGLSDEALRGFGQLIYKQVLQRTGIPVSVGIAPSKTLCKVANYYAKKISGSPFEILMDRHKTEEILRSLPVEEVWGVGGRHAYKLRGLGIETAYELSLLAEDKARSLMTIHGAKMVQELRGQSCYPLELKRSPKQSICVSRSFSKPARDIEDIRRALSNFAERAGEKLRSQGSRCSKVTVFITTSRFDKNSYYNNEITIRTQTPTSNTVDLLKRVGEGLNQIYRSGYSYKKSGVILSDITPENPTQATLFTLTSKEPTQDTVQQAIDKLNQKFGLKTVCRAQSLKSQPFEGARKLLSPRYTTSWDELLQV